MIRLAYLLPRSIHHSVLVRILKVLDSVDIPDDALSAHEAGGDSSSWTVIKCAHE